MAIKNIIFDLGAVILNLDQDKTLRTFKRLGIDLDEINMSHSLFTDFETGKIDANYFIHSLHSFLKGNASKEQIISAWNAMLLDLPEHRLSILKSLKNKYKLYLLSNTNTIHMEAIYQEHGQNIFEGLFEKIYLSHEIGYRKPNKNCYQFVLQDANIVGSETIFIDDNKGNIRGAEEAGINTIWAKEPLDKWFLIELKKTDVLK